MAAVHSATLETLTPHRVVRDVAQAVVRLTALVSYDHVPAAVLDPLRERLEAIALDLAGAIDPDVDPAEMFADAVDSRDRPEALRHEETGRDELDQPRASAVALIMACCDDDADREPNQPIRLLDTFQPCELPALHHPRDDVAAVRPLFVARDERLDDSLGRLGTAVVELAASIAAGIPIRRGHTAELIRIVGSLCDVHRRMIDLECRGAA